MVNILQAIFLGIVQGITEWLPISSSGHLAIFSHLLKLEENVSFDIVLHIASLIVVMIVFRKEILWMIEGLLKKDKERIKFFAYLCNATIPIGLIGVLFNDLVKESFSNLKLIGAFYLVTAVILFLSRYPNKKTKTITLKNSLVIGIMQGLAILPGVSRSGTTISAGLMQGVKKEEAARFSFLLFIPAILGASVLEAKNILAVDFAPALVGGIAAIITGLITLKVLLGIIKKGNFHYFSIYCLGLGIILLFI
ncbi:MAG: undecaprenyl-diphosphate phosphatase [archaeon]